MFEAAPVVRLTRPTDINALKSIDLKSYDYPLHADDWSELVSGSGKDGSARIVVVTVSYQPVGYAMWSIDLDHLGKIERLAVLPQYRRKGIGTLLLAAAVKHLRESDCDVVRVTVPEVNCDPNDQEDVSKFLIKNGFNTVGVHRDYAFMYGYDRDGFMFERNVHNAVAFGR